MNLQQTIRRILREEFDENRKERIFNKVVNVLTTSIYPREKGNKIIFWFITDQLNEPVFEYNKPKKTLKVLKGRVKNYLDTFVPESLGDEFRNNVLTNVFNNLTSNSLTLNKIIVEHKSMMGTLNESKLQKQFQDEIDSVGFISFINQSGLSIQEIANVLKTTPMGLFKKYILHKKLSTKDFSINTGTYDFNFRIDDLGVYSDMIEIYVVILGGEVTIDDETYDLIESDLHETEHWLEVQYEIKQILEDIVNLFIDEDKYLELTHSLEDRD